MDPVPCEIFLFLIEDPQAQKARLTENNTYMRQYASSIVLIQVILSDEYLAVHDLAMLRLSASP